MANDMYKARGKTSFDIQYIIIGRRSEQSVIIPPIEFQNDFLSTICFLPQNLLQLDHALKYILLQWQGIVNGGYDLSFIYQENALEYLAHVPSRLITVVFIEEEVDCRNEIAQLLTDRGIYYFLFEKSEQETHYFSSHIQLINKIVSSKSSIEAHFLQHGVHVQFNFTDEVPDIFKSLNKYNFFLPSLSNFWTLNQYIGNIFYDNYYRQEIESGALDKINSVEEFKTYSGRSNRIELIVKQISDIDQFRVIYSDELSFLKKMGDATPFYTPLIVISPFQYPQLERLFPGIEKAQEYIYYKEAFKNDQDLDYRNLVNITNKVDKQAVQIATGAGQFNSARMGYLDQVAYLHASYTFSPILRLPLQGRTINKYLSFFNPATRIPNANKLASSIEKFGRQYSKLTLSDLNAKKIFGKNRQIVAISDLPVEWMRIDDLPLCVTHDVTRIPELPYGGIMSHYMRHTQVVYQIPENILEKTLVVFGVADEAQFNVGYDSIRANSKHIGYKTIFCNTVAGLKKEIELFQPHLIIFDTHGKTDPEEKASSLQIGDEFLTGKDIIKDNISAPMIVLSACSTTPNWGYFNNLANAFFEAGALAVTGTFLPIGILSGTIFYNRILNNLKLAQKKAIHNNWLNFMSHIIRTHYISEIMLEADKVISKANLSAAEMEALRRKLATTSGNLMAQSMSFSNRQTIFQKAKQAIQRIHPILGGKEFKVAFEQQMYTNLGRGDLIMFESWLKEYSGNNVETEA